jgi:hypothetical protein
MSQQKKTRRFLVLLVLTILFSFLFGAYWLLSPKVIFRKKLFPFNQVLEITKVDERTLWVTAHARPGFIFPYDEIEINETACEITFSFLADQQNHVYLAYDNCNLGIYVLCYPPDDNWCTHSLLGGLRPQPRDYWQSKIDMIRKVNPDIPDFVNIPDIPGF